MGIAPSASAPTAERNNAFEPADIAAVEDEKEDVHCWRLPFPLAGRSRPPAAPPSGDERSQSPDPHPATSSSRRLRSTGRAPKQLLWGCSDAEDHHARVADACARIARLHGAGGLRALGLEYRDLGGMELGDDGDGDDDDWEEFRPPGDGGEGDRATVSSGSASEGSEYLVPLGASLRTSPRAPSPRDAPTATADDVDGGGGGGHPKALVRSASNASVFSFSTHNTWSSGDTWEETPEDACAMRLVRVFPPALDRPPTLVGLDNFESFIAAGKMYDETARLCTEVAQAIMQREGDLIWVTICEERRIRALVSRRRLTTASPAPDGRGRRRPVLLLITGKGKVCAGIFSRRHTITLGIEAGTALPMVREAARRDMDVVILDPNANGDVNGMDTVDASLRHLFPAAAAQHEEGLYVVAHSGKAETAPPLRHRLESASHPAAPRRRVRHAQPPADSSSGTCSGASRWAPPRIPAARKRAARSGDRSGPWPSRTQTTTSTGRGGRTRSG